MLNSAHLARWPSPVQRAATRWCAVIVGNISATAVTRRLMDMTISGISSWKRKFPYVVNLDYIDALQKSKYHKYPPIFVTPIIISAL